MSSSGLRFGAGPTACSVSVFGTFQLIQKNSETIYYYYNPGQRQIRNQNFESFKKLPFLAPTSINMGFWGKMNEESQNSVELFEHWPRNRKIWKKFLSVEKSISLGGWVGGWMDGEAVLRDCSPKSKKIMSSTIT